MTGPSLTVNDLFTPAPSGVGPNGNVPLVPDSETWLGIMLQVAATVQLPTTSWQSGAPERTILAIEAVSFSQSDAIISTMAQGAFLDSSATGSVTYVTLDGTSVTVPVTPDPSNPAQNPTGALGWEDLLTQNVYDVERLAATAASGPLAIANVGITTRGPYAPGQYHVGNTVTSATYANTATLSIPSSAIAGSGGVVNGVMPGLSYSIVQTAAAHGLTVGQSVYIVIPQSSGVSGLYQVFGIVTAATSNTFQVSISSSGSYSSGGNVYLCTVGNMAADVVGIGSNAGPGQVTTTITQNSNVFASNVLAWSGSNWESNVALADRTRLSLGAASPNGPSQAYQYFAETAQQFLAEANPPYTLTNGPVSASVVASVALGIVEVTVASDTPVSSVLGQAVTPGVAQLPVSGVTNSNPCVVSCTGPTTLQAGQSMAVTISGVLGTNTANGTFLASYVSADSFSIPIDTTTDGVWSGGGSVEGGDLGQIDQLLQRNVVPDGIVGCLTQSALALPIVVVATVVVPAAFAEQYRLSVVTQLQTQIKSYAVGGNPPDFAVAYNDIIGALEEAGVVTLGQASYVLNVQSLSLNGGGVGVGVPFPTSQYQAILATPVVTVVGV